MRVRRCGVLMVEPAERVEFDLQAFTSGGSGLRSRIEWIAHAPHTGSAGSVSAAEVVALGEISASQWLDANALAQAADVVETLLAKGLLVEEGSVSDARDQKLREAEWRPASAITHFASRWHGVDTEQIQQLII